ncbi:hypothetical protein F511_43072 [Dorcoceras hygrometricum]|uniref:Uncharacterized protein n=1 Tax=Dorcoceras hygrometricum TaxID=472368 RepID=A0A2Z7A1Y0_9LAMI|nr:hypothetical protein F511_43072 [Dorcoceras hygrometricum]
MTSAFLLKEAVISKDDVSNISRQLSGISDDDVSRISNHDVSISLKEAVISKDDVSNISRQLSGISDDDVSSDVITISSWIRRSAKENLLTDVKNKGKVECFQSQATVHPVVSYSTSSRKLQYIQSQATVYPVASYSEIKREPAIAHRELTRRSS